jgi:hypothetical protein
MRLVVMDPQLLIRVWVFPHGPHAKLFALFAYGQACWFAREGEPASQRPDAEQRRDAMAAALPMNVPNDLMLATTQPLLDELGGIAQKLQRDTYLEPESVRRAAVMYAKHEHGSLPLPWGDPSSRPQRQSLIRSALFAGASTLITADPELLACRAGEARGVTPITFTEFAKELEEKGAFAFDDIDAPAVMRAALT